MVKRFGAILLAALFFGAAPPPLSTEELRARAEAGNRNAQFLLFERYWTGNGIAKNVAEAVRWLRLAAEQGMPEAQNDLGLLYEIGNGVPRSDAEALRWYNAAAAQGLPRAQLNLGVKYTNGNGVARDLAAGVRWTRAAADQGYALAEANLGFLYASGLGVPQSYAEAIKWYIAAAEKGEPLALYNLGTMYDYGEGIMQDDVRAAQFYRRAAEGGHDGAQNNLGSAYLEGSGVEIHYVSAYAWFQVAIANGNQVSAQNRELAASRMTAGQIAQGQELAARCLQSQYNDCDFAGPQRQTPAPEPVPTPAPRAQSNDAPELESAGSGFYVSAAGDIVTNAHVVDGCREVRLVDGTVLSRVAIDAGSDLAVYRSRARPTSFARLRSGRGARPGEAVVVVGFPLLGLLTTDPIITTGSVSALAGLENDRRQIQISAPIQPGNSGGPVLGEDGALVGVAVETLSTVEFAEKSRILAQNVNFAVSHATLQAFLTGNGVAFTLEDRPLRLSSAEIASAASRYTMSLECWN